LDICVDPDHGHNQPPTDNAWVTTYDSGRMDGACDVYTNVSNCSGSLPSCYNPSTHTGTCPYSYVNNGAPPTYGLVEPYFQIALNYGFANWMFQTNQGPSFPAHQFLFSGTSAPTKPTDSTTCEDSEGNKSSCYKWFDAELTVPGTDPSGLYGCVAASGVQVLDIDPQTYEYTAWSPPWFSPPDAGFPCYDHNTLPDLLGDNNTGQPVSWRYYAWSGSQGEGNLWDAPVAIEHICQNAVYGGQCQGPDWPSSRPYNGDIVLNPSQILTDLGANPNSVQCNLQQVSWVIPDGTWSDHPGITGDDAGPSWVAAIVNAAGGYNNDGTATPGNCGYWPNTVILVTWDDWGGWYDDVLPWNCDSSGLCSGYSNKTGGEYVYGFRVPLLVVSAWTPPGYVSGSSSQGVETPTPPYVHDFGSILNFTEWALGQNGNWLSLPGQQNLNLGISPSYSYADYLAPDGPTCTTCNPKWSLADFFLPFTTGLQRKFVQVTGWKYDTYYFLDPSEYFPNYPHAPDDDAVDSQD
jgi:hypothetical protein